MTSKTKKRPVIPTLSFPKLFKTPRSRSIRHKLLTPITLVIFYILLILITAITAAIIALTQKSDETTQAKNPFTLTQLSLTSFPLYYPDQLPEPLKIDPTSVSFADTSIVTMRVTDGAGSLTNRALTISQQALPQGFDLDAFNQGMENKHAVDTPYGDATIGTINLGQTKLATLVADNKTLILVQADSGITQEELSEIVQQLEPAAE